MKATSIRFDGFAGTENNDLRIQALDKYIKIFLHCFLFEGIAVEHRTVVGRLPPCF